MSKYKFACSHFHFVLSCRLYIYFVSHVVFEFIIITSWKAFLNLNNVGWSSVIPLFGGWCEEQRKEWSWEGGHPPIVLRGGFATKPFGGYKNTFLWNFVQHKLVANISSDLPISQDHDFTGLQTQELKWHFFARSFLLCFSLISSRLNSALRIEGSGGLAN